MGRVSGRRSRSYDLAGGSPYLPDEEHAMYRRARSCRQAATFRNFGPLFQKNAAYVIIRWRDSSVARVVSREDQETRSKVEAVLFADTKSTRREVGCIKPLSSTNTLTLSITE